MAKQYKVLKEIINAPVGTILEERVNGYNNLYLLDTTKYSDCIVGSTQFDGAIAQSFIEEYTPEPKHWRAKKGYEFYVVSEFGDVYRRVDYYNADCDDMYYKSNNYYRTYTTAELVAKAKKLMLEWLHDKDADGALCGIPKDLMLNLLDAMDDAREDVLEDDGNE